MRHVGNGLASVGRTALSLLVGLFALTVPIAITAFMVLQLPMPQAIGSALGIPTKPTLDFSAQAPADRLESAAAAFADAAAGAGMTFQVMQGSVLYAKPGGPLIEIPHPTDRYRSLGYTDRLYIGGLIADGTVLKEGFYLAMRQGPAKEDGVADFAGQLEMAALTLNDETWRNDGAGWYSTKQPPGIGLDTATVALLPQLLRQATGAEEAGTKAIDGLSADVIRATGKVANAPGLLAIDGEGFTELREPISFALDDQGRLVELTAVMRNTNSDVFDLIVTSTITFRYGNVPALPVPLPLAPPPLPLLPDPGVER